MVELTANERLQSRAIARQLFIERFKAHEVAQIVGFLDRDLYPAIINRVQERLERISANRGIDVGPVTTRRLRELEEGIREILKDGLPKAREMLTADLVEFAGDEVAWQAERIRQFSFGQVSTSIPTARQLRSIVVARPFQGRLLRDWFRDVERSTRLRLSREIRIGIASGETNEQIIRRVRGTRDMRFLNGALNKHAAETLVRTSVQHVANHSREALFADNADIIKQVIWISSLDSTTCAACMSLDGQTFPVGQGVRPPLHGNCRCATSPVLKSWKELGIDLPEAEEGTRFFRAGKANARKALTGQVPKKVRYNEWLRGQGAKLQDEALGPTRGALFRRGDLDVKDFVDRRGRQWNLDELRRREAAAFASANL